ncbi:MAG TPA: DUF29 domain-containing protein [Geminicoccaceae bacterium]|nr:DUF29 domain-containing protein [Geminicoccaceae bacterium]
MARAKDAFRVEKSLYERDFCLWVEEQARLLRERRLEQLDIANLVEEIEDLGASERRAIRNNLVVVLKHLLKCSYQPSRRSRSWLSSIVEHRRRLRDDLATSPSLEPYARERFEQCYRDSRRQALIETGLEPDLIPTAPPWSLEQALDPDFLPD